MRRGLPSATSIMHQGHRIQTSRSAFWSLLDTGVVLATLQSLYQLLRIEVNAQWVHQELLTGEVSVRLFICVEVVDLSLDVVAIRVSTLQISHCTILARSQQHTSHTTPVALAFVTAKQVFRSSLSRSSPDSQRLQIEGEIAKNVSLPIVDGCRGTMVDRPNR